MSVCEEKEKQFFQYALNVIKELKKSCDKKTIDLCNHKFIEDLIETGPETAKYITYCEICEYTVTK